MPNPETPANPPPTGLSGCLVNLGWMLYGNAILLFTAASISKHKGFFLSLADAIFWATVVACIVFRYISIARMNGYTLSGERATLKHWRRYTVIFSLVALALWAGAHTIAYQSG